MRNRHGALASLAEKQHGVVSLQQLIGPLGYSRSAVARGVEQGRLHRLYRGVFAVGHRCIPLQGRCLAAVFACGQGALLSHHSAAWLWGIAKWSPVPIHVTTRFWRSPRPPLRLHQSRTLTAEDWVEREGIPVTAIPRTLLDLAACIRVEWLERIIERTEELKQFDLRPVEALLERTSGHPGWGRLRRAIALYAPPPFTRSEFERDFFAAVLEAGLPRPVTNFVEAGFELDLYWPEHRFAVELDTFATHGSHQAFERDRLRAEDLMLAEIAMDRVTDVRFAREPDAVLARLARLLGQRRSAR